jgi:ParB-like chromosome segregation protein Spo0J
LKIQRRKISELKNDPANARKHSSRNLKAIRDSLDVFGQQKPIVVDSRGVVIAGNGTLEAARELGWDDIAVTVTDLDPAHAQAFGIADNRTAELAEWDTEVLSGLLEGMDSDLSSILSIDDFDLPDDIPDVAPPSDFDEVSGDIETEHRCPSCGYEWSGNS